MATNAAQRQFGKNLLKGLELFIPRSIQKQLPTSDHRVMSNLVVITQMTTALIIGSQLYFLWKRVMD
jgi:hypothetical protein